MYRALPLVLLLGGMGIIYTQGWHRLLTFDVLVDHYSVMRAWIEVHFLRALFLYIGLYVGVVLLSLPAGFLLTVSGGILFGWKIGAPAAVFAATLGATLLFVIAKSSFGPLLHARITPVLETLREGFQKNAMSYLLFLRLVMIFPFFVVNLAAAFLHVPLKTFIFGTVIGILPATFAFSYAGSGLRSVLESQMAEHAACLARQTSERGLTCTLALDTRHLLTNEVVLSLTFLGLIALVPVFLKHFTK